MAKKKGEKLTVVNSNTENISEVLGISDADYKKVGQRFLAAVKYNINCPEGEELHKGDGDFGTVGTFVEFLNSGKLLEGTNVDPANLNHMFVLGVAFGVIHAKLVDRKKGKLEGMLGGLLGK